MGPALLAEWSKDFYCSLSLTKLSDVVLISSVLSFKTQAMALVCDTLVKDRFYFI